MKCQECIEEGLKSQVYPHGGSVTCMGHQPYYDEDGVYHSHDPNWHTSGFSCSNGHRWTERWQAKCPAEGCEYGSQP